jgi:DNA-binding NarL/FixJ family response regulator
MPFSQDMWHRLAQDTKLSPRQKQIMSLLLKGYSDKQIVRELNIGLPTVRTHMTRLFAKAGACDRCELIIHYVKLARVLCSSVKCPLMQE